MSVTIFSEIDEILDFYNVVTREIVSLKVVPGFFLMFVRCAGLSKDRNNWFLGGLGTSKNPEIIEIRGFGFSHKQIDNVLDQIGEEEFPGALNLLFK